MFAIIVFNLILYIMKVYAAFVSPAQYHVTVACTDLSNLVNNCFQNNRFTATETSQINLHQDRIW